VRGIILDSLRPVALSCLSHEVCVLFHDGGRDTNNNRFTWAIKRRPMAIEWPTEQRVPLPFPEAKLTLIIITCILLNSGVYCYTSENISVVLGY
jgi:hypothetical protein